MKTAALFLFIAVTYYVLGKCGIFLAPTNSSASAFFPAAGFSAWVFAVNGNRIWPAVWLGSFLLNLTLLRGLPFITVATCAVVIACGSTLQGAALGVLAGRMKAVQMLGQRALIGGLTAMHYCLIASVIGTGVLFFTGAIKAEEVSSTFLSWIAGDYTAVLLVFPILAEWYPVLARRLPLNGQTTQFCYAMAATALLSWIVFSGAWSTAYSLVFLPLIPLMFMAAVFPRRFTVLGIGLAALMAVYGTINSLGPFVHGTSAESLTLLQIYIVSIAMTVLVTAGFAHDSHEAHHQLELHFNDVSALADLKAKQLVALAIEHHEQQQRLAKAVEDREEMDATIVRLETQRLRLEAALQGREVVRVEESETKAEVADVN